MVPARFPPLPGGSRGCDGRSRPAVPPLDGQPPSATTRPRTAPATARKAESPGRQSIHPKTASKNPSRSWRWDVSTAHTRSGSTSAYR